MNAALVDQPCETNRLRSADLDVNCTCIWTLLWHRLFPLKQNFVREMSPVSALVNRNQSFLIPKAGSWYIMQVDSETFLTFPSAIYTCAHAFKGMCLMALYNQPLLPTCWHNDLSTLPSSLWTKHYIYLSSSIPQASFLFAVFHWSFPTWPIHGFPGHLDHYVWPGFVKQSKFLICLKANCKRPKVNLVYVQRTMLCQYSTGLLLSSSIMILHYFIVITA